AQLYVLGAQNQLLPKGAIGELHIGGVGLARGYLNQPELTQQLFVANVYGEGKLYKTGDLVRYLPNGNLEFIGRIDDQVKIRGLRVELGEVEQQLSMLPKVNAAVVVVRDNQLVAYVTGEADTATLKTGLRAILPDHMVPSVFVWLDTLPLTPNGKIDKKALPKPKITNFVDYIAPASETEQTLVQLWAEILLIDADNLSAKADFFALGGHSILLMRLLGTLKKRFSINMTLAQLFDLSRLNCLAAFLDKEVDEQALTQNLQVKTAPVMQMQTFSGFDDDEDEDDDMEAFDL
ncbi:MAG: non-ribosomal peptide synthetase, partial [Psychrosphaera sp.]|nr:non-ribosomal peptide synthetase [Psychrosphaera sp.]